PQERTLSTFRLGATHEKQWRVNSRIMRPGEYAPQGSCERSLVAHDDMPLEPPFNLVNEHCPIDWTRPLFNVPIGPVDCLASVLLNALAASVILRIQIFERDAGLIGYRLSSGSILGGRHLAEPI